MPNRKIKLKKVTKVPSDATVLKQMKPGPLFTGEGTIDFVCPTCDDPIAVGLTRRAVGNVYVICPVCATICYFQ